MHWTSQVKNLRTVLMVSMLPDYHLSLTNSCSRPSLAYSTNKLLHRGFICWLPILVIYTFWKTMILVQHRFGAKPSQEASIFTCENPHSKHMEKLGERIMTFVHHWPKHIRATPKEMASAGFFYLGTHDRVKCFYCNGGLQNWHLHDDPWFEHAKWYPDCEYVLKTKGILYVENVASQFPAIKRPFQWMLQTQSQQNLSLGTATVSSAPRPVLVAADSAAGNQSSSSFSFNDKFQRAMQSDVVKEASNFGFETSAIASLIKRKIYEGCQQYASVLQLVSDLQKFEDDN